MGIRYLRLGLALGNCPNCQAKLELKETFVHRKGLVSNIKSVCSDPHCPLSRSICGPYNDEDTAINDAAILGMRMGGQGRFTLNKFSACLGALPPLENAAWTVHNKRMSKTCMEVSNKACVEA